MPFQLLTAYDSPHFLLAARSPQRFCWICGRGKISLVVRNFDTVGTREIQYAGGLRYPHLERIPGTHDYLTEILAPRSVQGQ